MLDSRFGSLRPWEMGRLKPQELQAIYDRLDEINDAARESARTRRRG